MYRHLATLAGGVSVLVDTYPDFRIDAGRVEAAMTARTKCVVVNTPANPTGVVATADEMRALAELCRAPRRPPDQRRGLPGLLLRSSVRHAGELERRRAGRRRLQQDLRHDRLAARLRPRPEPADPGDGQAPAIQLRLCAEHGPVRRRRGPRPGPDRPDRGLPPQARHGRRGARATTSSWHSRKAPSTPSRAPRGAPPPSSSPRRSRTTC